MPSKQDKLLYTMLESDEIKEERAKRHNELRSAYVRNIGTWIHHKRYITKVRDRYMIIITDGTNHIAVFPDSGEAYKLLSDYTIRGSMVGVRHSERAYQQIHNNRLGSQIMLSVLCAIAYGLFDGVNAYYTQVGHLCGTKNNRWGAIEAVSPGLNMDERLFRKIVKDNKIDTKNTRYTHIEMSKMLQESGRDPEKIRQCIGSHRYGNSVMFPKWMSYEWMELPSYSQSILDYQLHYLYTNDGLEG